MTSMIADPHEIQRLRYAPDQDLLSRDFRDQAAFEEQLRWWHNRAMHETFGVRSGLAVSPVSAEGTVEVAAGLAYDALGRELRLPDSRTLRVPAGPRETEPRVLVIHHREDGGSLAPGGPVAGCFGEPASQGADLAWLPARQLRPTSGVPLAGVLYSDGQPGPDPGFHRPVARPLARPRLGRGSTVAGATAWSFWSYSPFVLGNLRVVLPGLEVRIDTRAAGFTRRPCYFAWLQGAIPFGNVYLQSFQWIERSDEDARGFRFRLFYNTPVPITNFGAFWMLLLQARQRLSVCWLGIQPDDPTPSEVTHEHA